MFRMTLMLSDGSCGDQRSVNRMRCPAIWCHRLSWRRNECQRCTLKFAPRWACRLTLVVTKSLRRLTGLVVASASSLEVGLRGRAGPLSESFVHLVSFDALFG